MSRIDQYEDVPVPAGAAEFVANDPLDTTQGANGSTKRVYADQVPALVSGMTATSGMLPLLAAVLGRSGARCDIPVIGDSITEGQGATVFGDRWIAQANAAIRAAYPGAPGAPGGIGFIPMLTSGETSYTWPVTLASGGTDLEGFDLGPVRNSAHAFGTTTWTWTAPPGTTSVKIMWFDAAVSGSFTYKVGSASTTTVTNVGSSADLLTASIPIASGQVLTIAWASGDAFVDGILHFAGDESSGVTLHGCGHFGWGAQEWNAAEVDGLNWAQTYAAFPNPVALGIMLGVNDASTGGDDRTAAQFESDIQTLVSTVRGSAAGLAGLPLILVMAYQPDETFADAGGWPAYVQAARSVAAADSVGAIVVDLSYRMPVNTGGGTWYADTVHPDNLGHALVGALVAGALEYLPPVPLASPVYPNPTNGLPQVTTPAGLTSYVQQAQPAATSAVTVASTAAIASLGSLAVPADDPVAGAKYKVTAHGTLSIASAGTATTYVCDLRWGGTAGTLLTSLHSTATANSPLLPNSTALSAVPVLIEGEIEFRTSTTVVGWLRMTWTNGTTAATAATVAVASITSPVTVTTSSPESLSLDWTWGTSSASNTITIASSSFERVS